MGAVTFSLDPNLIQVLHRTLPLDVFIETGTFKGDTVASVQNYFKQIYSVELSKEYYQQAQNRFQNTANIKLIQGDSGQAIRDILSEVSHHQSILFWLDAHWCVAENTAGQMSQCPLLAELDAIPSLNSTSIIIIDDARLFLTTPPAPHEASDWPTLSEIVNRLFKLSSHHKLMILNDCILFFPESIEKDIANHAYKNGIDWLTILDKSRDYDTLLQQLKEKEELIQVLNKACEERQLLINKLSRNLNHPNKFVRIISKLLVGTL